jgi:ubiquinone/menaquinone biosynthesis C-methylase UbiE
MSFILDFGLRNSILSPQTLASRLALTATSNVLEVGAGSGFYSVEVAHRVPKGHLELTDVQPEMLLKAQKKLEARGLTNVAYTLTDSGELPFKEFSFDVIFLVTVLGEITDQKAFLREAYRVLKTGGMLSISEHYPDPDFSPVAKVNLLVLKEGFELLEHFGSRWNYTVNFRKPC